ncbi:MAG TPA: hypothetical protein VK178_00880 [Opitutaceae bacterium]|nr:hypothetical protein [Opitutaceae bacterium]
MKALRPARRDGPSGTELVEESIQLLRRAPLAAWLAYFAGAVPWVAGVCYFWARASWFAPGPGERAFAAAALVALFAALKAGQSAFCAHLLALRLGAPPPTFSAKNLRALAAAQLRLQVWGVVALPLAAVLTAPFGWVYALHQNATVLGAPAADRPPLRREAWALAEVWPAQNHLGLLWIQVLAAVVWLNLAAAFYAVPWLATRFLGCASIFELHGVAFLNTTFLTLVTSLTWLAVDPLVKAFYTLRVFHSRSRKTGDDLRSELARLRPPSASLNRAAAALLATLLFFAATPRTARAAEPTQPPTANSVPSAVASVPELDHAINRTLEADDFQWALRPLPSEAAPAELNAVERFFADCSAFLQRTLRSIGRTLGRFVNWLEAIFGGRSAGNAAGAGAAAGAMKILLYALLGAAVLGLCWLAAQIWKSSRARSSVTVQTAQPVSAAVPDLRDESVQAAQLPYEGWLELARAQIAAGEWRLALRALYLATLARRAAEGLLVLTRFKTNLDYERELARRALTRRELVEHFRARRRAFEDAWYGDVPATEPLVRDWLAEFAPTPAAA